MTNPSDSQASGSSATAGKVSLDEIAIVFLKLGTIAFGGPAAHIAMMEDEMVRRRGWLTREKFLDLMAAANLIPGPTSTEVAIHIGYLRGGLAGLIVGGCCFILPAMLMVGAIAWAYVRYAGSVPQVFDILYGVKPVVIAIIVQALARLGSTAVKNAWLGALLVAAVVASGWGFSPLVVMLAAGGVAAIARWNQLRKSSSSVAPILIFGAPIAQTSIASAAAAPIGLWPLFLVFLKIGAIVFGSGYVLLAFLREDLIVRLHWLTEAQLLDATAIGQVTPGPVFTTATFVGYLVGARIGLGWQGAIVATVAIFLPAFVLVAISGPLVPRLRKSPLTAAFLDGCNVAALALMAVVSWQLGQAALVDPLTIAIAAASVALLLIWRVNPTWLIAGGALLGLLFGPHFIK